MKNNLFGLSESVVERALRGERERADLFRNALGGSGIVRTIKQATEEQKLLRSLDLDAPYRGTREALAHETERRKAFKQLASTAWAMSVQETARGIVQQHHDLFEQQRHLAISVIDTVKAFDTNRSAVATAIAAASAGESYQRMVADALPGFSVYGAIAERMRMLDAMTLRASKEVTESATALVAETVLEAQRLVEAIAQAPTDEEGARLFGDLLDAVLTFVTRLGPNTIPELQKMGLVGFASFIIGILSLYTLIPQAPTQSPQDKAAFVELNRKVEHLHRRLGGITRPRRTPTKPTSRTCRGPNCLAMRRFVPGPLAMAKWCSRRLKACWSRSPRSRGVGALSYFAIRCRASWRAHGFMERRLHHSITATAANTRGRKSALCPELAHFSHRRIACRMGSSGLVPQWYPATTTGDRNSLSH